MVAPCATGACWKWRVHGLGVSAPPQAAPRLEPAAVMLWHRRRNDGARRGARAGGRWQGGSPCAGPGPDPERPYLLLVPTLLRTWATGTRLCQPGGCGIALCASRTQLEHPGSVLQLETTMCLRVRLRACARLRATLHHARRAHELVIHELSLLAVRAHESRCSHDHFRGDSYRLAHRG